ncbi:hypothetical protein [Rubrivirga sp. IMCC43871]|uniref:hypothetical protein n=1 Tax=Rubrivirga sp. IMCC43871 TaxID=3391575 RepID=UPI00398FA564
MTRLSLLALLLVVGCDTTTPGPDMPNPPDPEVSARVQCIGDDPAGVDVFPIVADSAWAFSFVSTYIVDRQGTTDRREGTLTWTFGEGACEESVWATPVAEQAVLDGGEILFERDASVLERADARLRFVSGPAVLRETAFAFEVRRFQPSPADTLAPDVIEAQVQRQEVRLAPGRGVVALEGYQYFGFGTSGEFRAVR